MDEFENVGSLYGNKSENSALMPNCLKKKTLGQLNEVLG